MWTLFRHEMSAFTGTLPDSYGRYRAGRLENALAGRPGWCSWQLTAGPHPVAFAVARALDEPRHVLSSFFVVIPARREGVGAMLATAVIDSHPGRWSVAYQDENTAAAQFWRHVAEGLDPDWWHEHRPVPGQPDLVPDSWIHLDTTQPCP
ncbi:GNAT family N-acetyltransferase [Flexivirga caeni]|uniref:GNAT family N-acetyltransferase n=1 Tax=Flexivirga caeni TaxID=2294115 RepID=UPI001FE70D57|nr:GNAT family N-acetyltransferase [Flexivirga caeni]